MWSMRSMVKRIGVSLNQWVRGDVAGFRARRKPGRAVQGHAMEAQSPKPSQPNACEPGALSLCGAAKVAERLPPMALDSSNTSLSDPDRGVTRPLVSRVEEALAFDDVLIIPAYSQVLPAATRTTTRLTRMISLN